MSWPRIAASGTYIPKASKPGPVGTVANDYYRSSKGGAKGTRTPDPHTASVVRYQLRHSPKLPGQVIKRPAGDLIGWDST